MNSYQILGISKKSTTKEIRERYLCLAKQWHPDKHHNSVESVKKFQEIEYAYKSIINPSAFKKFRPPPPPPPPPPSPAVPKFKKNQNLDDFLNELYNEGRKKTGKKKDKWT